MKPVIAAVSPDVVKQLDGFALSVIGAKNIQGFEKAYLLADAIEKLKTALTPEYMAPIMQLQGNKLGFKTDKDKTGGYPVEAVKNCLIEAVLMGLQPVGNEFNIIAGNTYPTKEGCGTLLKQVQGLQKEITPSLPRVNADKTGAAISMEIEWTYNGETKNKKIEFPIKIDQYTTVDAIIGKGTRKARMWLYNTVTGNDLVDGEVQDVDGKVVSSTMKEEPIELEDLQLLFEMKKEFLNEEEVKNAERILETKEVKSYSKLQKTLSAK